jgi:hypothetical protein
MDRDKKKEWQDLLTHPAWERFKAHVLTDQWEGSRRVHRSVLSATMEELKAAVRSGDLNRASQALGKMDVIDVILKIPENEYNKRA